MQVQQRDVGHATRGTAKDTIISYNSAYNLLSSLHLPLQNQHSNYPEREGVAHVVNVGASVRVEEIAGALLRILVR